MRHRRKGRVLGRSPSHQRALLRNLAAALFLTEREVEADDAGRPKMSGRIVTTVAKAKEVRPLVERCITIAKKGLVALEEARVYEAPSERDSPAWKRWRSSEAWQAWAKAMAPVVVARRRVVTLLGDKQAAKILFERVAPRYRERPGGYTRILKLARPRLGDAGPRAILELVQDPLASAASAPKVSSRRR
ncbi:MAG: bL17 family ribosomal protein [Planctomycetaceae bacterium]